MRGRLFRTSVREEQPLETLGATSAAPGQIVAPADSGALDDVPFDRLGAVAARSAREESEQLAAGGGAAYVPGAAARDASPETAGPRRVSFAPEPHSAPPGLEPISDLRVLEPPYAAIAQIEAAYADAPDRRLRASGFRVGEHLVLTAARILHHPDHGRATGLGLYFNNGADQPLSPKTFRVAKEWARALASPRGVQPPLAKDDYGVIFVAPRGAAPDAAASESAAEPFPYLPVQAVDPRWFRQRDAAQYRLAGYPASREVGLSEHVLHEAVDFALPDLAPSVAAALEDSVVRGGAARFLRHCVRHRAPSAPGFLGAPLMAAIPNARTTAVYEAAVALHLGAAGGFAAARVIDDELKRRLVGWAAEARRLIAPPPRRRRRDGAGL